MTAKRVLIMVQRAGFIISTFLFQGQPGIRSCKTANATQIPNIHGRIYPSVLAGKMYPDGIKIFPGGRSLQDHKGKNVDLVVFSYSDVEHKYVMEKGSQVLAAGANYMLPLADQDADQGEGPGHIRLCSKNRLRKEPDVQKITVSLLIESGKGGSHPPSDALRRSRKTGGPALCIVPGP